MKSINESILTYLKENKIRISWLADNLHYSRQSLYKLLKSHNISVNTLHEISITLNHDFYHAFYPPIPGTPSETDHLKNEIALLEKELKWIKQENEHLSRINNLLTQKLTL